METNSSTKQAKDSKKYAMARLGMITAFLTVVVCGVVSWLEPQAAVGTWGGAAFICIGGIVSTYCYKQAAVDEAAVKSDSERYVE